MHYLMVMHFRFYYFSISELLFFSSFSKVGRAGRFGTKGLAITFVASASDSDVLNQVNNNHYIF